MTTDSCTIRKVQFGIKDVIKGLIKTEMKHVFIQTDCKFPRSGAFANYVENLSKAISCAGYQVVLLTDVNKEYNPLCETFANESIKFIPIVSSDNMEIRQIQRETGFCTERIQGLKEYNISKEDRVIIFGLRNDYFLNELFALREEIGFKIICGVLELFGEEDFNKFNTVEPYSHYFDTLKGAYLQADAILSISEYIDKFYIDKGMRVWRFPPMVECGESTVKAKRTDKRCFIILSEKDSMRSMLMAFADLQETELRQLELHLCGVKKESIQGIIDKAAWNRLQPYVCVQDWMKYEKLLELYQQMHFLVIARNICQRTLANFPSKVPETMTYGVVPIVSDVGDYTKYYLTDGEDSIFIKGDSAEKTREAIRMALSMNTVEYEQYSKKAMDTARRCFDYRVWVSKIGEMLEMV